MLTQIAQAHASGQMIFYEVTSRLGKQHLPPVPCAHDASSKVHVHSYVALGRQGRLTRVQPHAHTYGCSTGPGVTGQRLLCCHCCRYSAGGASKSYEERIPLCIDLDTVPLLECRAQQAPALGEDGGIAMARLPEKLC